MAQLRHTELTDKEVDGVIDHADESVTTEKLADGAVTRLKLATGIDASSMGFNAEGWGGFKIRKVATLESQVIPANSFVMLFIPLTPATHYLFLPSLTGFPGDPNTGFLVPCLRYGLGGTPYACLYNFDTNDVLGSMEVFEVVDL